MPSPERIPQRQRRIEMAAFRQLAVPACLIPVTAIEVVEAVGGDERVVEVEITRKGMALREQLKDIPKQVGTCVKLSKEDARILYRELYKMLEGFDD